VGPGRATARLRRDRAVVEHPLVPTRDGNSVAAGIRRRDLHLISIDVAQREAPRACGGRLSEGVRRYDRCSTAGAHVEIRLALRRAEVGTKGRGRPQPRGCARGHVQRCPASRPARGRGRESVRGERDSACGSRSRPCGVDTRSADRLHRRHGNSRREGGGEEAHGQEDGDVTANGMTLEISPAASTQRPRKKGTLLPPAHHVRPRPTQ
jgi:hypothetical protein